MVPMMKTYITERTSKRLKAHLALSMFLMMFSGLGMFVFDDEGRLRRGHCGSWAHP
jgi:hypothetical protein